MGIFKDYQGSGRTFYGHPGTYVDKNGYVLDWRNDIVAKISTQRMASQSIRDEKTGKSRVLSDQEAANHNPPLGDRTFWGIPAKRVEKKRGLFRSTPQLRFIGHDERRIRLDESRDRISKLSSAEINAHSNWRDEVLSDQELELQALARSESEAKYGTRHPTFYSQS